MEQKTKLFILASVIILLGVWFIGMSDENTKISKQDTKQISLISQDKTSTIKHNDEIFSKKINQNKQYPKKSTINQKQYYKSYYSTHMASKKQNKLIEQKMLKQQRDAQAKVRYERKQQYIAQQRRAQKGQQNYHKMQQLLSQKDPNRIHNKSEMMQNKQVRSYIAKINYQQRQRKIQQQMKLRAKMQASVKGTQ